MMILERQIAYNKMQHCSSLSYDEINKGVFLTYYSGESECDQTQHVEVQWFNNNLTLNPLKLENMTGNPVLIPTPKTTYIIYSKFETSYICHRKVQMWQYCTLWISELIIANDKINIVNTKQLIVNDPNVQSEIGYLPRCNPIKIGDEYLLPLYREHKDENYGVILTSNDGYNWNHKGNIKGELHCIQPTLWHDERKGKICALLRNFKNNLSMFPFALYSESTDGGFTWSDVKYYSDKLYNANNSVHVINTNPKLIIWNNSNNSRSNLNLGSLQSMSTLISLDNYGSYPSACLFNDKLLISYTAKANPYKHPDSHFIIKIKEYDLKFVLKNASYL